jgi:hypothetical protein
MTVLIALVVGGQLWTFDTRSDCERYRADFQITAVACTPVPVRLDDDTLE